LCDNPNAIHATNMMIVEVVQGLDHGEIIDRLVSRLPDEEKCVDRFGTVSGIMIARAL
jgi:hypothetical protein